MAVNLKNVVVFYSQNKNSWSIYHAPLPLINFLHFTLSFVLSMSGGKEQRYLVLSDIEIGGDSSGKDMSTYRKTNQNKTR
jgi:hypothetical protein